MGKLAGKVAIVTGGARGLGKTFCLALAAAAANVVVADILEEGARQTSEEILAKGGKSLALRVDVTSEEDTRRMVEEALNAFGRIDILVNNAAMIYGITRKPFVEIPLEEWDRLMTVNLKGPFLCCRAVFPQMKKQGKGKIINLSSETAFTGSRYFVHYVTSKGGIISFTRSLAAELGQYQICVNAVAPGFTDNEAARSGWNSPLIWLARFCFLQAMKAISLPARPWSLMEDVICTSGRDLCGIVWHHHEMKR